MTKITNNECIELAVGVIQILKTNGFHVQSAQEALDCLQNIIEIQVYLESISVGEDEWQN